MSDVIVKDTQCSDWHPIETAPKDEYVLVACPEEGHLPVVAMRIEEEWYQTAVYGLALKPKPTIWARWPKLPIAKAEAR